MTTPRGARRDAATCLDNAKRALTQYSSRKDAVEAAAILADANVRLARAYLELAHILDEKGPHT